MSGLEEIEDSRQGSGSYRQRSFLSASLRNHHGSGTNTHNNSFSELPTQETIFKNSLIKKFGLTSLSQSNNNKDENFSQLPLASAASQKLSFANSNENFLHSRTSQSQLQLNQLISSNEALEKTYLNAQPSFLSHENSFVHKSNVELNQNGTGLDDYELEELRDGFFDPVFPKHTPIRPIIDENFAETSKGSSAERADEEEKNTAESSSNGAESTVDSLPIFHASAGPPSHLTFSKVFSTFAPRKIDVHKALQKKKKILKFFIAYFIAMVLSVIPRTRAWFGSDRYIWFLPLATLIHHPSRTVGVQVEIAVWAILGGSLSIAWSALALYIATCNNAALRGYGGILWLSMTLAIILSVWLGSLFRRLVYFSTAFNTGILFTHTVSFINAFPQVAHFQIDNSIRNWKIMWDFGMSYLFGILISTVVSCIVFPDFGNKIITDTFAETIDSIENFLVLFIDPENFENQEELASKEKTMVKKMNYKCTQAYREYSNQLKLSKYDENLLKNVRNSLTNIVAPLRCVPLNLQNVIDQKALEKLVSGVNANGINLKVEETDYEVLQDDITALRKTLQKPLFDLILQMIICLDYNKEMFKNPKVQNCDTLHKYDVVLQDKIQNTDKAYKNFIKSKFFNKELLRNQNCVEMFLFLRYLVHSANHLVVLNSTTIETIGTQKWHIVTPSYPLSTSLRRLPHQCALDQGNGDQMNYSDTKRATDEIFENIYNANMSKHIFQASTSEKHVKAISRNDFNKKTTTSSARWIFWNFKCAFLCDEMRWALKVCAVMFFFCLPSWLPNSYKWYQKYQVFTGAILLNILMNRRNIDNWGSFAIRLINCVVGVFWGWAANQSRHFASPYVIMTFASLICAVYAYVFFVNRDTKASYTALLTFTIIVLEPLGNKSVYSHHSVNTATIWKSTWVTGLALFFGCALSIPINWVLWTLSARTQVREGANALVGHIGKSYQFLVDRYLYRDVDDEPSLLELKYSNVSEIRLSQSIDALEELLNQAKKESEYIMKFKAAQYEQLIQCSRALVEKLLESRLSAQFFDVWNTDADSRVTRSLLSFRRDSVSTVCFVFFMLSNCFQSKNKVPPYLPNPILSRKKLYDAISRFDTLDWNGRQDSEQSSLFSTTFNFTPEGKVSFKLFEKKHWQEVHAIAFSSAFTGVTAELQRMIEISKQILGEETRY
ncbi:hypothetical protein ACO0QE_000963 [Hanseniaspora vineae]